MKKITAVLDSEISDEIRQKLIALSKDKDLQKWYLINQSLADELLESIPVWGKWEVPDYFIHIVQQEIRYRMEELVNMDNDFTYFGEHEEAKQCRNVLNRLRQVLAVLEGRKEVMS